MKIGLTISIIAHAAAMLWGLISFAAKPLEAKPNESMPVEIVSATELTQLMAGNKTAPKAEKPKPLVEKIEEPKPPKDLTAKVDNKELQASKDEPPPPPPPPEPKVAEKKPEKKEPEPKIDPLAEQMKKEKEEAKKLAESKPKVPTPPKRPAPPQPKFDPNEITALLDKRKPQRLASTGRELNNAPTLGTSMGNSATLSQNEIDALKARLMSLWNPPAGARTPEELMVTVRIQLNRDGRLSGPPMVLTSGQSPLFHAARESAVRAVFRGQPYDMLSQATYEAWKDIEITFDPREMFRG